MQPDYHKEGFSLIWVIRKDTYKEELEGEDMLVCLPPAPGHRCPSEPAQAFSLLLTSEKSGSTGNSIHGRNLQAVPFAR